MDINITVDENYNIPIKVNAKCKDCGTCIVFGDDKPWYETTRFAVLPFKCPACNCSGSFMIDMPVA